MISTIEPNNIWNNFEKLNSIPRASKKEENVVQFIVNFGENLGLQTEKDHVGNVLIRKPATAGLENRKTVVLQSHLDMVHQKNADTIFDFDTQGIDMYIDGDLVRALGTTLGADNGIGVATIMAILESSDIPHPGIEALFTIDEETGMTGALGLKGGWLTGDILLNLDTEEDDELGIGCAGGMDVTASSKYTEATIDISAYVGYNISVKGLNGGHSGVDIHKGFGNANKIMNRILSHCQECVRISSVDGGSLRNAIPRESIASFAVLKDHNDQFEELYQSIVTEIKLEFASLEPNLMVNINKVDVPNRVMIEGDQKTMLRTIYGAHNGVFRMSPNIVDLVEASNNLARVEIRDGLAKILCLTRSSVESSKNDVANSLKAVFEMAGMRVEFSGAYPGWSPNINSPILHTMKSLYEKMFGTQPHVAACHAGLECGILGQNYPNMDMISFGPTIKGAHSPDERVSISSVQKFWQFTKAILLNIPDK